MSIVKSNNKQKRGLYLERFAQLAKMGILVAHADDLARLWQIDDAHNLHMTLKRYADRGLLMRIYRGLYALKPLEQLDPSQVGLKALHRYAYISTETILVVAGILQQHVMQITMVSDVSRKFSIGSMDFLSRKLADRFLYNETGVMTEGMVRRASVERAVADMLYFNPKAYFDGAQLIDWKKVRKIQQSVDYPLTLERYL